MEFTNILANGTRKFLLDAYGIGYQVSGGCCFIFASIEQRQKAEKLLKDKMEIT